MPGQQVGPEQLRRMRQAASQNQAEKSLFQQIAHQEELPEGMPPPRSRRPNEEVVAEIEAETERIRREGG